MFVVRDVRELWPFLVSGFSCASPRRECGIQPIGRQVRLLPYGTTQYNLLPSSRRSFTDKPVTE